MKKWELLSIAKQEDKKSGIIKLKNSFDEIEEEVSYIVKEGCDIAVNNKNFELCEILMKKECKKLGSREKWFMYQIVDNTEIPITSIPERIIAADTTTLSYAFMLDEKGYAIPIPDKTPSLYAYLPMEDRRYLFPFYINADFELSSNRQNAKQVSVWNEFLFYHIGKSIVSWVATLASLSQPLYLTLLPKELLIEDLEESKVDKLAVQFNRGYTESLLSTPFILNDKEKIVCQSDVIVDETGFANIIGANDFCELFGLTKRLVNSLINIEPLRNTSIFTEIEHLQFCSVVERILDTKNRFKILRYWLSISKELRSSLLVHIANMPGNRKNLDGQLCDIPAFTSLGELYSYNKLLVSKNVILRVEAINGIEPVLLKLGFEITDEQIHSHAFSEKLTEQIIAYSIHLFDIISEKTKANAGKLTAQEKSMLFAHFVSSKMGIKNEELCQWEIFKNQNGQTMPISELTHMDSSLYNDITRQYVIDENEYLAVGKSLDRYLMKEKDQFDKIVIKQWDSLTKEVGNSKDKVMSLYLLASTTYTVAEHEQADESNRQFLRKKDCIFVSNQMHNLDNVILNTKIAAYVDVIPVIELLSDKLVPEKDVIESVVCSPFNCKEQPLSNISLISDKILSFEQTNQLLDFCLKYEETVFKNYYLVSKETGFSLHPLAKNQSIAYTNNQILSDFIVKNCANIILLPGQFSNYKNISGILTEEELLLKVLEIVKDVKAHATTLLPIYINSISSVKTEYLKHLSSIVMNENSFMNESDINYQSLLMASSIEKQEDTLFDMLRSRMFFVLNEQTYALTTINLQHTIELGNQKYPLSKLLPNEDKIAMLVDTLKERLESKLQQQTFIEKLFGEKIDKGRADEVFAQLNRRNTMLENGAQLAFVIKYCETDKLPNSILCNVYDVAMTPNQHLINSWYLNGEIFMDCNHILSAKYQDVAKYINIPYKSDKIRFYIKNSIDNFKFIKDNLTEEETKSLLDYLLNRCEDGLKTSDEDLQLIKERIGFDGRKDYVISSEYSLPSEVLPTIVEQWRMSSDTIKKNTFLGNVFNVYSEDSDIVKVRKYLTSAASFSIANNDTRLSKMICCWIFEKALVLNNIQFTTLVDILDVKDYRCEIDNDILSQYESSEYRYAVFGDYCIYLCDGEIPWKVQLTENDYVLHTYQEKDVILSGCNIYVNRNELHCILDLVRSLINTDGFTAEDFMQFFDQEQSRISGTLDGENDDDIDEVSRAAASELAKQEAIEWLNAKGYDTSNVKTSYSFVEGVCKGSIKYNIVVKSFRSSSRELKINPNEWLHLLKPNSRLMLYMGHMSFAVVDRKLLLGNHDFLRLRISSSNFSVDGNKLEESLERLANDIQYFERTHFIFERVHENILSRANSLDDYGLFKNNSNQEYSAGNEEDIE